jgi:lipopolysaccharide transport system permease protein
MACNGRQVNCVIIWEIGVRYGCRSSGAEAVDGHIRAREVSFAAPARLPRRGSANVATTTAMPGRFAASAKPSSSFWDLLVAITIRDMRVKYRGTFLSYFWWIARPLTLGLVLYFALNRVLAVGIENQAAFLLAALFPWFWFQGTLFSTTSAFLSNASLIKKVQFPRIILPLSIVLEGTLEFVITIPVLVGIILATGADASWTWVIGIPLLVAIQLALLCGLGLLASCMNVFFRDTAPALNSLLTLLFYVTPIIYPLDSVPSGYRHVLMLNPLTPLIEAWRGLFLDQTLPGLDMWPALVFTVVSLVLGLWALRSIERTMADAL